MGLEQSRWMRPVGKCGRKRDIMSDEKNVHWALAARLVRRGGHTNRTARAIPGNID